MFVYIKIPPPVKGRGPAPDSGIPHLLGLILNKLSTAHTSGCYRSVPCDGDRAELRGAQGERQRQLPQGRLQGGDPVVHPRYRSSSQRGGFDLLPSLSRLKIYLQVVYTNRSLCYSMLEQWERSLSDANQALQINSSYVKAYHRSIKACLELQRYLDARSNILLGYKHCGEIHQLKLLDEELFQKSQLPAKLFINDFRYLEDLGEGNFTRIYLGEFKRTGNLYAIKLAEKETIEKVKKRHKNVYNELYMEKRVLSKLSHVNIVRLFATFQDASTYTLYFLMEYFDGGEIWKLLRDPLDNDGFQVGVPWNLVRYYIAATLDAIEYMHRKGIVHRDLKPENMMLVLFLFPKFYFNNDILDC